jgi:hypothetical protein
VRDAHRADDDVEMICDEHRRRMRRLRYDRRARSGSYGVPSVVYGKRLLWDVAHMASLLRNWEQSLGEHRGREGSLTPAWAGVDTAPPLQCEQHRNVRVVRRRRVRLARTFSMLVTKSESVIMADRC